jgi:predicted metal-dependent phosphoesterase TrpH
MEVLAACHMHSEWSYDGSWSLDALSDKFSRRGCRVLLMTEHDRGFSAGRLDEYRTACAKASSSRMLVVPGIEYSDAANRVHVLVWGVPFLGEGLPTGEMLDAVRAAEGVAVLAHPSRRNAWQCFDPSWADRLLGIEAWNRKYDGWAPSETASSLMQTGDRISFVGMDFHTERQVFPLAMALDISGAVTEQTVLECLKSRRCSARAFGVPLDHLVLRSTMPVLGVAERGRRKAAAFVRHTRALAR